MSFSISCFKSFHPMLKHRCYDMDWISSHLHPLVMKVWNHFSFASTDLMDPIFPEIETMQWDKWNIYHKIFCFKNKLAVRWRRGRIHQTDPRQRWTKTVSSPSWEASTCGHSGSGHQRTWIRRPAGIRLREIDRQTLTVWRKLCFWKIFPICTWRCRN